jgi:hypothetical protein
MANLIKRAWDSKATGITAAAILVLVLIVVIVAFVLSFTAPVKPGAQGPQQTETAPVSPSTSSAQPTADAGPCNVPAGDMSYRPKMPADLRWEAVQGITSPASATVGPTKTQGGFPVCFARSPLGAALMGTTFLSKGWQGASPRSLTDLYVADSSGKQALLNKGTGAGDPKQIAAAGVTPAGFIVDAFTPDEAHVTIVATAPGTQSDYIGFPFTFVWVNADWRIKALDSGDFWAGSTSAPVKGQFVEWRQ